MDHAEPLAGFYAPVHRALTEPILLGGAPTRRRDRERDAGRRSGVSGSACGFPARRSG